MKVQTLVLQQILKSSIVINVNILILYLNSAYHIIQGVSQEWLALEFLWSQQRDNKGINNGVWLCQNKSALTILT